MTRRVVSLVALVVVVFVAGAYAQNTFNFAATRIVMHRALLDEHNAPTPITAHYILDEWNDVASCSRVLSHQDGRVLAISEMPLPFCQPAFGVAPAPAPPPQ